MLLAAAVLLLVPLAHADPWPSLAIPPTNLRSLTTSPRRPAPGAIEARARRLFDAIRSGEMAEGDAAEGFFLGRDPFLAIKYMSGAAGYFNVLLRAYRRDIARYHGAWPAVGQASFVRFELSTACTWMAVGHEANRLPYWSCYHSRLVARAEGREHAYDVRVMIQWGDGWYCTHLGPSTP